MSVRAARSLLCLAAAFALAGGATLVACKEGSTLVGSSVLPIPDFSPDSVTATDHVISLRKGSIDGTRITIDVVVTEVDEPVTGIALKLRYPKEFSRFDNCSDGELFPPAPCYYSETAPGSGEVFVGRSITAPAQATSVSGSKVIVRLEFIVFGQGSGSIVFEGQNLGGGDASALLDIDGNPIFMNWFSGEIKGM